MSPLSPTKFKLFEKASRKKRKSVKLLKPHVIISKFKSIKTTTKLKTWKNSCLVLENLEDPARKSMT